MKLQLTKTKTIEFGGGRTAGGSKADITGLELFAGDSRGCPCVRIRRQKNAWHLVTARFVPSPEGTLPEKWEEISHQPHWALPAEAQSPHAALAVNSAQAIFAQTPTDAVAQDMARGLSVAASAAGVPEAGARRKFGIKRAEKPAEPKAAPKENTPAFACPPPGVPTSANGMRFSVKPTAEAGFVLEAAIPEYQALWLSRLLPEGRRPTACSIQVRDAALMASVLAQPAFRTAGGNALVIFFTQTRVAFAGYKAGEPVLWRICPGVHGVQAIRECVRLTLGIEEDLIDSVLDDQLVDPRAALEPIFRQLFDELELARVYLSDHHALKPEKIFLAGLRAGAGFACKYAHENYRLDLVALGTFDGFELPAKPRDGALDASVTGKDDAVFLTALGAALAAAEVTI